jgi:hypothetical protein
MASTTKVIAVDVCGCMHQGPCLVVACGMRGITNDDAMRLWLLTKLIMARLYVAKLHVAKSLAA